MYLRSLNHLKKTDQMINLTTNEKLLANIEQIKNPSFNKKIKGERKVVSIRSIQNEWKEIIVQNQKNIERLFDRGFIKDWGECIVKRDNDFSFEDELYALLINWLTTIDWTDLEKVRALYYYTEILSNNDYKPNGLVIFKYHKNLQIIIKDLIKKPNFKIVSTFRDGNFGRLVENIIHLYFYHSIGSWAKGYLPQFDIDKTEMATLIPEFVKAFPNNCSNLVLSILEDHPQPEKAYADLLQFYMRNGILDEGYCPLSLELFSIYNKPSDLFYKEASKIIKLTVQNSEFSNQEIDYLIEGVLLAGLNLINKEGQIQACEARILRLKKFNPESEFIADNEKKLSEITQNWDATYEKNRNKAIRRIAVSRPTLNSMEVMVKAFPNHPKISVLEKLLLEAKAFKDTPKLYNLNTKPKTEFEDFHFKLLVIEELMYQQKVLLPIFDLDKFVKEYTKREIEIYTCEAIPEVKKYFKNLDIPKELLAKVTTLYQDSGLNGGSEFINQLFPDWDPGAGDEVFKITNKAVADLELLPNLKKIIGIEASNPSKKLIKAFETKDIILELEED